jgi:hypothetical protein
MTAFTESGAQSYRDNQLNGHLAQIDADDAQSERRAQAVAELLKIPAFVDEAIGDHGRELAVLFVADDALALSAAIRRHATAKAKAEIDDALRLGDRESSPVDFMVRSWHDYESKKATHPAAQLCACMDARVSA